jgi:ABC-2 type transport system permease protein
MEFPIEFGKVWAMTRRDISRWATYKTQAVTSLISGVLGILAWGLNATYVNRPVPQYNTDYISFLIVGVLITSLILPVGTGVQNRISPFTLETILMAGIRTPTFILGTVVWPYVLSVVLFIPQLIVAEVYFGAHLDINPLGFVVSMFVSTLIIFSLSMISTGFRLVTKTTDPVTWGLGIAATIFAGVTFPVQHLNDFIPGLSNVSYLLPQTWIYNIVRLATLTNASLFDPATALIFAESAVFAVVLVPMSFWAFRWGMHRAKKDGTLGHF